MFGFVQRTEHEMLCGAVSDATHDAAADHGLRTLTVESLALKRLADDDVTKSRKRLGPPFCAVRPRMPERRSSEGPSRVMRWRS
jgi:hypothetical protein